MRRHEDKIFLRVDPALRPAFAEAAAAYVTANGLTVDLPYRQGGALYLVNPYKGQVVRLFENAFLDFCRRDGGTTKRDYERKAKALRTALVALDIDDPASCVLLYQWDFPTVIRPALEAQADAFERQAKEHGRYSRNISFEKCIRDRFAGHPLPQAALVQGLARKIADTLEPVDKKLAHKIKVTSDSDTSEVQRRLRGK